MFKNISWIKSSNRGLEKYIFLLVVLINCIPVLVSKYVVTMDGAAHLANATYIQALTVESNTFISDYFSLNEVLVPNWLGHGLLVFFKWFFPGYLAEKAVLLTFLIGLPYSFRYLIKQLNPSGILMAYWILPFTYNLLFLLGFYNFSLGLVLLFWIIAYMHQSLNLGLTWPRVLIISVALLFVYFAHIFVFGLTGILLAGTIIIHFLKQDLNWKLRFQHIIKTSLLLLLTSIPALILAFIYLQKGQGAGNDLYKSTKDLMYGLSNLQSLIIYNFNEEIPYVKKFIYLIGVLGLTVLIQKVIHRKNGESNTFFNFEDWWFFACALILFCYFVLPDETHAAGFISIRLALLFFMLVLVAIAAQIKYKTILLITLLPLLFLQGKRLLAFQEIISTNNHIAIELEQASEKMQENKTVLPLNYSSHWLYGHLSNYLAADKPVVVLENYEANLPYFPVIWNFKTMPTLSIDTLSSGQLPCITWLSGSTKNNKSIDYIVLIDYPKSADSCQLEFHNFLMKTTKSCYRSEHVQLFKMK